MDKPLEPPLDPHIEVIAQQALEIINLRKQVMIEVNISAQRHADCERLTDEIMRLRAEIARMLREIVDLESGPCRCLNCAKTYDPEGLNDA